MLANHPLLNRPTEVEIVDDTNEPWVLVRCKETDFHFIQNPPSYERLSEEFAWEKTLDEESERRHREERMISIASDVAKRIKFMINPNRDKMFDLAKRVLKNGDQTSFQVIDVGCGNGKHFTAFCDRFRDIGINIIPSGIEVSTNLAKISRERFAKFGGDVIEQNAIAGMKSVEPESIDMVTMLSFLEHEAQPLELLAAVRKALRPDGTAIVKVPNFACWNRIVRGKRWAGYRYPDHVSYFTPDTLELLATEACFKLEPQNFSEKMPLNDNMYAVLRKVKN